MKTFRLADALPVPTDVTRFTGRVRSRLVAIDDAPVAAHVYRVEFEPLACTHWHIHTGPQWLFVIEGRIRVQRWGEAAQDLSVGDAVVIEPGEKHWHGAAPGSAGTHLAVNINATTEWLESVT